MGEEPRVTNASDTESMPDIAFEQPHCSTRGIEPYHPLPFEGVAVVTAAADRIDLPTTPGFISH